MNLKVKAISECAIFYYCFLFLFFPKRNQKLTWQRQLKYVKIFLQLFQICCECFSSALMNWKRSCLQEHKTNFSLIYRSNEAAVQLLRRVSEAVYVMVKHTYKVKKLMETYYRLCAKLTFFKFMSRSVYVDSRHSENIHFREKVNIQGCNRAYKVSCQFKRERIT